MAKKKKKGSLILNLKNAAKKAATNKKKATKTTTTKKTTTNKATTKATTNKATTKSTSTKPSTTAKKSGVVVSQKSAQKKQAAKKADNNLTKAIQKTANVKSTTKALEKGQKRSALGTKVEKKTETYVDKNKEKTALTKGAVATFGVASAPVRVEELKQKGYTEKEAQDKVYKDIKKDVKSVGKTEYEYTPMTMQEYGQMEVGARTGQLQNILKTNKDLNKKVTDLNVKDYVKGSFGMGAMDQMTQGRSVSEDPIYNYTEDQKKIINAQKETAGYKAGRVVGAVAEFAGTGYLGSSMFKTAGKEALKEAGKQGGKTLFKTTAKNVGKDVGGDFLASAGLNALDALKFSYKDGKFDGKTFAKELGTNLVGDVALGGLVSSVMHGVPAAKVLKFTKITEKLNADKALTESELKFYRKNYKALAETFMEKLDEVKNGALVHKLYGRPVSSKYADALKKLESGQDISVEEYLNIPEIADAKTKVATGSSKDIPDNVRGAHREDVARKMVAYGSAEIDENGKVVYTGIVNKDKRADIILGLPASGKSSALVDPISFKYKSKLIDSDEAKKMLDGYDDGWGSGYVHEESSDIVDDVLSAAVHKGENIVIPKVGGKYKSIEELRSILKDAGYSVNLHLVEVNPNKAAGRNLKRFATTGRFVDLEHTSFKYGNKPTEVYEQLVKEGKIDGYTRYSNDVKLGEDPVKLEGTEDISYNWRNDRQSGGNDSNTIKGESGTVQEGRTAGLGEVSETGTQNASSFNATKSIQSQVDEMRKAGATDDEIIEALEKQGVSPYEAMEAVDGGIDPEWNKAVEEAYDNPGKQYDNAKERIFSENKSPEEILEKSKRIEEDELPRARQTAKKLVNQAEDDVADIIEPWVRDGYFNKKVLQSQADARTQAAQELADGTLYRNFMDSNVETNEHLFMARAEALLNDLMKKAPESDDAAMQLLEVMDKATDASSHGGRLLNATKMLLRNTSEGRIRMFKKEIDRLNERFKHVLKGKKLELTPEQIKAIANATEENIEEIAERINLEIWEDIPATWFEKFNEMRHASMLFNLKTHGRNVLGNSVFWGGRLISDGIEIAAYKIPAVKRRLEKLGGDVQMVHVTRKELADNKEAINEIFDSFYKKSDSKNKFIESNRPHGMTAVKNKPMSKFIQTNYKLLEAEDMIAFKPEYRKNFVRWCKTHKVEDISKMSKKQIREANAYAMSRAERATFRDDSAFAKKIVGLKHTTATKKGKTPVGTAAYRAGNVALESSLPFVKTPVNILRRSVDYSPIGLARGAAELMTAKSADAFMQGVTHMASGLTGTGVFALGIWLANKDFITVKAGEESGDIYYDRDMGYQDYSLVIGGDKKYSWTIDWLSPMQVSLFMGANAFNNLSDGDLTFEDMLDGVLAIAGPMLDMSFMSSTKDTIQTFMEKVYRNGTGEDADWSGAIMKTLFGSVPQGYLNGFVPQLMSQTATAFDSKQRDTRSTLEDPIASSWDSFAKKLANKIPVLRNKVLNPKIDRFGEDVKTGNNIVTRLLNAYANPSTVKEIKRTDLDNEIIDIYNHMEDGDDKRFFYYNFTGNPSYDLGDGKRMSYDELYKYGKSKRIEQTKSIKEMVDSGSYKNMTWDMKADEIGDAHWTSQTYADQKTYGSDFALDRIVDDGSKVDSRAAKLSQSLGVSSKDFVDFYIAKEKLIARSHDSDYTTKALAVALSGNDKMAELYGVNIDKVETAKEYLKKGGSAEEYSTASCNIVSEIKKADVTVSKSNKALAAAYHDINKRTYTALGISVNEANMGAGLKKMGYDFEKLTAMQTELKYSGFDADKNGYINKSELVNYIESLGINSTAEKACLFEYLCTSSAKNPYGNIPDYLGFGSSGSSSGSGGGSGKSKSKSSNLPSWEEWVKDYLKNETTSYESVKFDRWDSPLDAAYRKKITSLNAK